MVFACLRQKCRSAPAQPQPQPSDTTIDAHTNNCYPSSTTTRRPCQQLLALTLTLTAPSFLQRGADVTAASLWFCGGGHHTNVVPTWLWPCCRGSCGRALHQLLFSRCAGTRFPIKKGNVPTGESHVVGEISKDRTASLGRRQRQRLLHAHVSASGMVRWLRKKPLVFAC